MDPAGASAVCLRSVVRKPRGCRDRGQDPLLERRGLTLSPALASLQLCGLGKQLHGSEPQFPICQGRIGGSRPDRAGAGVE